MRLLLAVAVLILACSTPDEEEKVLRISGSAVGAEGEILARQVSRFEKAVPGLRVEVQSTPDDATQRHQLYVQWLNAQVGTPDVLQLDVVWTPEFAAAGWILPLDRYAPPAGDFFPASLEANTWQGRLYAVPWFMDVGMLYWRTDLLRGPPHTLEELAADARRAASAPGSFGFVWQGARYEGLVTVFLEVLGGYGGRILGPDHQVLVDSPQGVRALTWLRDLIRQGISPPDVLTWHEEETRFAFQNGQAVFLRNWPYAFPLLSAPGSRVAGRFAVAPMPAAPGGAPTAALGGGQLAINAHSRFPDAAWRLVAYLTAPEQMLERAEAVGQYPARRSVWRSPRLAAALHAPPDQVLSIVESAVARPATPVWTELSDILQIWLHRALAGQAEPAAALREAAREMERVIERSGLKKTLTPGRVVGFSPLARLRERGRG
ncbi:MAG TPA: ABC transporter substrate-binding protein [Thermoanaerobaculia bacterium]|nr:ABC transporter substrate-binding protein [Thermoanaerobaculia bacterium]